MAALRLMREFTGNSTNAVFFELLVAARTDHELRDLLRPALEEHSRAMAKLTVRLFPEAARVPLLADLLRGVLSPG